LKESRDGAFADILTRLETEIVPLPEDVPPVGEAIRAFRDRLGEVTNMGESGDSRDLYVLLDELVSVVKATYTGSLCKAGCSACCDSSTAIFDVSPTEWARIVSHMATAWTDAERAAFEARFASEHAPRLRAYRLLSAIRFFEPIADRHFAEAPYRCPFLVDGRCSVYAARPLACRMYGHFATRTRWYTAPAVYACRKQTDYLSDVRATQPLHLPSANMVLARAKRLMKGRVRILPLWIAARRSKV
jgi:Fe-S-cluster containining protein